MPECGGVEDPGEDPVESPDPFAPWDSEVPGDLSDNGSNDGDTALPALELEIMQIQDHATSFIMDDEWSAVCA